MKRFIFGFFILAQFSLMSDEKQPTTPIPPFALITVPKSGSHLAIKALHLFTGGVSVWHTRFPSRFYIPSEEGFLYTHFCLSPGLEDDYAHLPQLKKIILIRDLRDVSISIVNQIRKAPWPGMTREQREAFLQLDFDEQLLFVINYDYDVEEVAPFAPNSLQVSLAKVAQQSQAFFENPEILTCRYENLVGPEGGGSEEAQIEELRKIALFLGLDFSDEQLRGISSQLYGNTYDPFGKPGFMNFGTTFRHGQIGGWKSLYKKEHKEAFKHKLGNSLIALGYAQDASW